jgi:hypothetical protein
MPRRLQQPPRHQRKGWRKPAGSKVVTRASRWGNPYKAKPHGPYEATEAVQRHRDDLTNGGVTNTRGQLITAVDVRRHLRGYDLICGCPPDQACHADTLIEIANN